MKLLQSLLYLIFLLSFSHNLNGQTIKKQYGSPKYITIYFDYVNKLGIDDLRFAEDSLRIRIWESGKLIDLSVNKDVIIGQKIFYIHTNPYRKRRGQEKIICDKINIENEQGKVIKPMIETICKHYPGTKDLAIDDSFFRNNSGQVKYDSTSISKMEERDGGITKAIEFSNRDFYIFSGWIPNSEVGEIIKRVMDDLEMEKYNKMDLSKMPKGSWYSYGGTTSIYKATFIESVIYKLSFWKRF